MRLPTALLLAALALGCAETLPAPPATPTEPPPTATADTLVSLRRTACYGRCPVYAVSVDGAGTVRYVGERHVRVAGARTATVDRAAVAALVAAFAAAGHAAMPDSLTWGSDACEAFATDHPGAVTTLRAGGAEKAVVHNHGCAGFDGRDALVALEDEVDRALGTSRWVR